VLKDIAQAITAWLVVLLSVIGPVIFGWRLWRAWRAPV
jgi:hypothetical protein